MNIIANVDDTRLDQYLANELEISRSKIQKLIKDERVLVNGIVKNSNYIVKLDDEIEINDDLSFEIDIKPEKMDINVLYEDDDLLIVNKDSGVVVHPAPGHYSQTLVNGLMYKFDLSSKDKIRPGIVHRIDKDTSGLLLVAKNDFTHERLSDMIKDKLVKRTYVALVDGVIMHDTGTIDAPIGRDATNRQKMAVTDINSKEATTHFRVLKRFKQNTLIECILETGRTHQIRVHLAYIKFPITNDPVYNNKKSTSFGQMLHSKSLGLNHPRTKEEIFVEAEPPKEFADFINDIEIE